MALMTRDLMEGLVSTVVILLLNRQLLSLPLPDAEVEKWTMPPVGLVESPLM